MEQSAACAAEGARVTDTRGQSSIFSPLKRREAEERGAAAAKRAADSVGIRAARPEGSVPGPVRAERGGYTHTWTAASGWRNAAVTIASPLDGTYIREPHPHTRTRPTCP